MLTYLKIMSLLTNILSSLQQIILRLQTRAPHNQFHHGTQLHNTTTGLIWAEDKVSLGARETLMAKECLKNGDRNQLLLKFDIFKVIMVFAMLIFSSRVARTSSRPSIILELVSIMKMFLWSNEFKPSCIWLLPTLLMFLCTRECIEQKILHSRDLVLNMLFGFTITYPTI